MTQPPSRRLRRTSRPDRAGGARGPRTVRSGPLTTGPGRRIRTAGAPLAPEETPAGGFRFAGSRLARQVTVLGVVLCVVALSLAYPLRNYLEQRSDLAAAVAQQHELEQRITELQIQQAALADPDYIAAEAKRRLQYVKPGDTVYVVQAPGQPGGDAATTAASTPSGPWYSTLWGTLSNGAGTAVDPSVLNAPVPGPPAVTGSGLPDLPTDGVSSGSTPSSATATG